MDDVDQNKKRKLSSAFRSNSTPSNLNNPIVKRIFIQPAGKENIDNSFKPSTLNQKADNTSCATIVDEDILYEVCFLCEERLDSLTDQLKEIHLHKCLDDYGIHGDVSAGRLSNMGSAGKCQGTAGFDDDRGLRMKEFFCVICDVNLSRKKLLDRCLHLKKCAKDHQMSTKQLLQFISPEDNDENDDETGDEKEGNKAEEVKKDRNEVGKDGVIDLLSDEESSEKKPEVKSAFSVLMANSRQQSSLLKGGFESKKKATATSKPKSTTSKGSSSITPKGSSTTSSGAVQNSTTLGNDSSEGAPDRSVNTDLQKKPANNRFRKKPYGNAARNQQSGAGGSYAPAYKKVQCGDMTYPIIVDGFQYASSLLSDCYFLTHFHSDHYMGLTKDFNCGSIYCSPTTANLVKLKLKVHNQHLIALDLETKYTITVSGVDIEVIFTEANHCPGAVCIYFKFPNGRIVFHTGDFRWTDQLLRKSSILRALSGTSLTSNIRNLVVYLDTTYCDATYDFPHQDLVINAVVDCVREENKKPGALFAFGAYAIGKERVFMAVAHELNSKVYVDTTRWKAMCCFDWSIEEKAMLTTDPSQSNIWVLSMNQINFNNLETVRRKKPTCNRIIAFQPTGWTYSSKHPSATDSAQQPHHDDVSNQILTKYPFVHIRKKDSNTIYSLPYSEHSSFSELLQFVRTFRPSRIVPTVNTTPDKVDAQIQLLKEKSGAYNTTQQINNIHPYQPPGESSPGITKAHTFPLPHSSSSLSYSDLFSSIETENSIFL